MYTTAGNTLSSHPYINTAGNNPGYKATYTTVGNTLDFHPYIPQQEIPVVAQPHMIQEVLLRRMFYFIIIQL